MTEYVYGCLMRPPEPGAVPRDGLLWVEFEARPINNGTSLPVYIWGTATYNRPLTDEEIRHYDFVPMEVKNDEQGT